MCEPVTIATGVLALAGAAAQAQGQSQAQKATARGMTAASDAEISRQHGFQGKQFEAADRAREAFAPAHIGATQEGARADREAAYRTAAAPSDGSYLPGQAGAPAIVRDAVDQARGRNANVLGGESASKARLESWGDALLGGRIGANRAAQEGALAAGFARGSAGSLAAEMGAAQGRGALAGAGTRLVGDGLTAGSAFAAPAIAKAYPTWGSVFNRQNPTSAGVAIGAREPLTGRRAGGPV